MGFGRLWPAICSGPSDVVPFRIRHILLVTVLLMVEVLHHKVHTIPPQFEGFVVGDAGFTSLAPGPQYLHWGLKYLDRTCNGLFGTSG